MDLTPTCKKCGGSLLTRNYMNIFTTHTKEYTCHNCKIIYIAHYAKIMNVTWGLHPITTDPSWYHANYPQY